MMVSCKKIVWCRRLRSKYKVFILVAAVLVSVQILIAINIFEINSIDSQNNILNHSGKSKSFFKDSKLGAGIKGPSDDSDDYHKSHSAIRYIALDKNGGSNRKRPLKPRTNTQENVKAAVNVSLILSQATCKLDTEAISALKRAKTYSCQTQIAELGCQLEKGDFYEVELPRYCPLRDPEAGKLLGCFKDERNKRDLTGPKAATDANTPYFCINYCLRAGLQYAGVQYGRECWCGDHYGRFGELPSSSCQTVCPGDHTLKCGGYLSNNIYNTGFGEKPLNRVERVQAGLVQLHAPKTARVVFVLTVNGRALRQVLRLFKAIFYINHYYYIHVDSRQEMLHRELSKLEVAYPNVKLSRWRGSTIWGGASLLQMQLRCMKDLLAIKDWHWDFFINLSESDFPVKTIEELTAWLTTYKDYNFLKSSGANTPKFLRKQGMDRTFFECETHMWRMGNRPLLSGIRMDGGSDWIGLNRQFCDYLINSKDPLVTGLKHYYKYTLLPAESFYHTVLHNSEFCETWVDNNMHMTNWRRKQGCQCQYKHIVDWCGCSPNDFKIYDLDRLKDTLTRPTYFARKFEAVVSNSIVNKLEEWLFGEYLPGTLGLDSYWQSEYSCNDVNTPVNDVYYTGYFSLARMSMKNLMEVSKSDRCYFEPDNILSAHLYFHEDHFKGVLVEYEIKDSDGVVYTFESFLSSQWSQSLANDIGPTSRLITIQVGTDYDPKELIFRNFGRMIGPNSDLVLRHHWGKGNKVSVKIVWIDPQNVVAGVFDVEAEGGEWVGNQKPQFYKPLQPGVWTVKLLHALDIVATTQFLVMPLSHVKKAQIKQVEANKLHAPPVDAYYSDDFSKYQQYVEMKPITSKQREEDVMNSKLTGSQLHEWIDKLMAAFWSPQGVCVVNGVPNSCSNVPQCVKTGWSSKSPDPKCELGQIDGRTGRIR